MKSSLKCSAKTANLRLAMPPHQAVGQDECRQIGTRVAEARALDPHAVCGVDGERTRRDPPMVGGDVLDGRHRRSSVPAGRPTRYGECTHGVPGVPRRSPAADGPAGPRGAPRGPEARSPGGLVVGARARTGTRGRVRGRRREPGPGVGRAAGAARARPARARRCWWPSAIRSSATPGTRWPTSSCTPAPRPPSSACASRCCADAPAPATAPRSGWDRCPWTPRPTA